MPNCTSCGAPILFVTLPSGKSMPVDARGSTLVRLSDDKTRGTMVHVHASHFSSCPNAAQHRKPKS